MMTATAADPLGTTGDRATDAHQRLRALLLAGDLTVGDRLKEIELADLLSVSRTPVREALHRLDVEGVVRRQGRSYVVAGLEPGDELAIGQVREALEPLAATLAAQAVSEGRVAPIEVVALREDVEELRRAATDGDAGAAAAANHSFHTRMAWMGGNHVLAETITRLNDRVAIASHRRLRVGSWAAEAADQHERIVDAIAGGDAAAAATATEVHVGRVKPEPTPPTARI